MNLRFLPVLPVLATRPRWKGIVPGILYEPCLPLDLEDPEVVGILPEVIAELFRAMYARKGGGLAAPQVGIRWQLAVVDTSCLQRPIGRRLVLINPFLEAVFDTILATESCLSLPGSKGEVCRHSRIHVSNQTLSNTTEHLDLEGYLARVVQHEIDHLQGILFSDRLPAPMALAVEA